MQRREFILTCAAVAVAPQLSPAQTGRFTVLNGDVLTYSDPFGRDIRFDNGLITIVNSVYPDLPPAQTRLTFDGGYWTQIVHRTPDGKDHLYLPHIHDSSIGIIFHYKPLLQADLAGNLEILTVALMYAEQDHPEWWAERPLFHRALETAMRKPIRWRPAIPDFLWTDEAVQEFQEEETEREISEAAGKLIA